MGVKKYNDAEVITAYLQYKSEDKVAEIIGCGHTTVWRIVKNAGIARDGWKHKGNGGGGDKPKITDEELIAESEKYSTFEIAKRHNMSAERVFRRARKLGIAARIDSNHLRRRTERYGCKEFDDSITIEALMERDSGICQICGKPVDMNDKKGGRIRRNYPTMDHIVPLSKGGTHTWNNIQLAHMKCNAGKCDRVMPNVKD